MPRNNGRSSSIGMKFSNVKSEILFYSYFSFDRDDDDVGGGGGGVGTYLPR